jgi:predicted nucleic acid-binding protein
LSAETQPVLLDTGVIVAWFNVRDHHHARCAASPARLRPRLVTCEAVIVESCYLLQSIPSAVDDLLANVERGRFQIPFQLSDSAMQVKTVLTKYRDTPADFADACLIQMADELNTGDILTLDSDFAHYRWRRNRSFNFLIPLG